MLQINDLVVSARAKNEGFYESIEILAHFSGVFENGKLYQLKTDFMDGGWALTYFLSGQCGCDHSVGGNELFLDGRPITAKKLSEGVCYIGNRTLNRRRKEKIWSLVGREYSVADEINENVKRSACGLSVEEICKLFKLSGYGEKEGRVNRILYNTSGEIWKAAVAIGFSAGKKIYCFPQVSRILMGKIFNEDMKHIIRFLKKEDCIIIIPTMYPQSIMDLIDSVVEI